MTTEEHINVLRNQMWAEAGAERARIEALLADIHLQRAVTASARKEDTKLTDQVKQWMALNGETEIEDGEKGYVGRLQERAGSLELDVISMVQQHPEMVVDLARLGLLKVDATAFRAALGKAAAVDDANARYAMPGRGSVSLLVEKKD